MKRFLLVTFCACALSACCRQEESPAACFWPADECISVLVDTDLGNDIDDALALDYLFKEAKKGKVEVLGIGTHKESPTAAVYADMLCCWCGYPDTRIGASATPVRMEDYYDYTSRTLDYVDTMKTPFATAKQSYEEAYKMYRDILAKAEDKSITFVSLGFGVELARLLASEGDEISPLSGKELVAKKVRCLSIMAGSFGEKKRAEFNVIKHVPSMQTVIHEWPTPLVLNPFEIGKQVIFPGEIAYKHLSYGVPNPISIGYKVYKDKEYDRPSWDILSMVVLTHPELFTWSEAGVLSVDDAGYTYFEKGTVKGKAPHYVLSATLDQPQALKKCMINTILENEE